MAEPQSVPWPPPGLPYDARVFQLSNNSKRPPEGYVGGHHRAVPLAQALLVPGPAACYGISLEGQYLLADFDVDCPEAQEMLASLPTTWRQRSRRGAPHLLYRTPPGFAGKRCRWVINGVKIGDLLSRGFMVGPGSTVDGHIYTLLDDRDPVLAPQALLDYTLAAQAVPDDAPAREQIPWGERDNMMASIAGSLWNRNFSEEAVAAMLYAISQSGVMEQPSEYPWGAKEALNVAQSARRNFERDLDPGALIVNGWTSLSDMRLVRPPFRWWVYGFIPVAELVMLYAKKARGKSTVMAWVAAQVTQQDGRFGFIGIEEPPWRFGLRAVMMGADRTKMIALDDATTLKLPRDSDKLRQAIELQKLDFLYFDAIYEHFPAGRSGENLAERTRHALSPLAVAAQHLGCTIVGTFHENKKGESLGSTEMENVGRVLLHLKRRTGSPDMYIYPISNLGADDEVLHFHGRKVELIDPLTNEAQMERLKDGTLAVRRDWVLDQMENKQRTKDGEDEVAVDSVRLESELMPDEQTEQKKRSKKRRVDAE